MATATVSPVISGALIVKDATDKPEFDVPSSDLPDQIIASVKVFTGENVSARPDTILLGTIADRRLRVRKAIPLSVSTEEGHVVVSWSDADEFAYGATTGDAVDEFSKTISELYFDLNDPIPLGKDLARVRDVLNLHIEKAR